MLAQMRKQAENKEYQIAQKQLEEFAGLKDKLQRLYRMQGFKLLARKNPNVSQLFGMVQQDLIKEGREDGLMTQQVTGRQLNMMEFTRMIERLRHQH